MAGQYRIRRKIAAINVVENQIATIDLPRGYDYESLRFRLAGTVTVTTAGTSVLSNAPLPMIQRIEIIADGKNTIKSVPGYFMSRGLPCFRNALPYLLPPSGFAIATYNVQADGVLDFAIPDGIRPKDTNFPTRSLSLYQLKITFGSSASMFGGAAVSTSALVMHVYSTEVVELADPKTGAYTLPVAMRRESYLSPNVVATNSNLQQALPVGNSIRGVIIHTMNAGADSNAVLNNVTLSNGVDTRFDLSAADIQSQNLEDYDILNSQNSGAPVTGLYVVDLGSAGDGTFKLSDTWDLSNVAQANLILDVNGNAGYTCDVAVVEFIPRAA